MSGPLLTSAFDPTLSYIACVTISLDVHKVTVKSLKHSQNELDISLTLGKHQRVSVLRWASLTSQNPIIALGLTSGSTLVYDPLTGDILTELESPAAAAISDFHYSKLTNTIWISDINGNIYEWDVSSFEQKSHFSLNDLLEVPESIQRIYTVNYLEKTHLVVATHSIHIVNISGSEIARTFPAHVQPINSLLPVPHNSDMLLTSAVGDRFINLYSISKGTPQAVFVALENISQVQLGVNENHSILTAITDSGVVEIFNNPLSSEGAIPVGKKKRRQQASAVQSRTPTSSIKLTRPKDQIKNTLDANLAIHAVACTDSVIFYSWLENASVPQVDSLKWLVKGEISTVTPLVLEKAKVDTSTAHVQNGHDVAAATHYNEGNAIVSEGIMQTADQDSEDEEEETLAERLEKISTDKSISSKKKRNVHNSAGTLSVILTQSLRNNDHSLLETVLANTDPEVIKNTISRINAVSAVQLLERIAERIARQVYRFDQLSSWLKWVIVIHGTVLTNMPGLESKLASLHATLTKKADTLPRLLEIQGRLRMIEQQNELKREILEDSDSEDGEELSDVEYFEALDDAEANGDADLLNGDVSNSDESGSERDTDNEEGDEIFSDDGDDMDGYSDIEAEG